MKNFSKILVKALGIFLVFLLACGVIYPAIGYGIGQLCFASQANGSIITVDGKQYGSELLAQYDTDPKLMHGRWMDVDTTTYKDSDGKALLYAKTENLSMTSADAKTLMESRAKEIQAENPQMGNTPVPEDLITVSGSGLDPDISVEAANYQADRIAENNDMSIDQVNKIIDECTSKPFLGIFGQSTVNVLKVNLMLKGIITE